MLQVAPVKYKNVFYLQLVAVLFFPKVFQVLS